MLTLCGTYQYGSSEISENYLRVFHLRIFVLALYAKVENSEMFANIFQTSLNCLFNIVKAFISPTVCKMTALLI